MRCSRRRLLGAGDPTGQVYQRAGLGYTEDRLRALWDQPPFSLCALRPMNKTSSQQPYFGEDFLWVLLATKESFA
jgi:hypothetical protein